MISEEKTKQSFRKQIFNLIRENLLLPFIIFVCVYLLGIFGYYFIGVYHGKAPSLLHCFYQVGILLTAVGFTDVLNSHDSIAGTLFTVILALFGVGFLLWMLSTITAFIVSGKLLSVLGREKMRKKIDELENHFIICGGGETGQHCVDEFKTANTPFVLIELDPEKIANHLRDDKEILYLNQDASEDETLIAAGIKKAAGLISSLPNDKDNLLVTITAKQLNPNLRIVSRAVDLANIQKLKKAGANAVVCPNRIGGLRMISEMVRPTVTNFLDVMMYDRRMIRIEEAVVAESSKLAGMTLADAKIPSIANVNVIATKHFEDEDFTYNPRGSTEIRSGTTLVVLGPLDEISKLVKVATS